MTRRNRRFLTFLSALLVGAACTGGPVNATVTANELAARIEAGTAPIVLDVRTADEYSAGHIPGAINISHDQITSHLGQISFSKDDEVVVYCRSGRRAGMAENILRDAGYRGIRDLAGHYNEWTAQDRRLEKPDD